MLRQPRNQAGGSGEDGKFLESRFDSLAHDVSGIELENQPSLALT